MDRITIPDARELAGELARHQEVREYSVSSEHLGW
ncbi:hypothetical protein SAMN04489726_0142 [Allokutzneria albata]|uniref:Uncharacterized protein n=1 Tax=Allokutzneria albata TaxID=211114 RepID=A0A1G9R171_ALLAB|nr:hypothetical protein SAMN04489726_0142 [Allokutzneria albata]